ncbi:MAG TPA: hypothetical protein VKW06_04990 [Candidatus Angelobacter sp.]|nr:hypothetical protein [Candidatus Angelobacter sp.]
MEQRKKFYIAMAVYAVLGLLIWLTIDNIPLPISAVHITLRQLTLGMLGVFVLRTVLHWRAEQIRAEREKEIAREQTDLS